EGLHGAGRLLGRLGGLLADGAGLYVIGLLVRGAIGGSLRGLLRLVLVGRLLVGWRHGGLGLVLVGRRLVRRPARRRRVHGLVVLQLHRRGGVQRLLGGLEHQPLGVVGCGSPLQVVVLDR